MPCSRDSSLVRPDHELGPYLVVHRNSSEEAFPCGLPSPVGRGAAAGRAALRSSCHFGGDELPDIFANAETLSAGLSLGSGPGLRIHLSAYRLPRHPTALAPLPVGALFPLSMCLVTGNDLLAELPDLAGCRPLFIEHTKDLAYQAPSVTSIQQSLGRVLGPPGHDMRIEIVKRWSDGHKEQAVEGVYQLGGRWSSAIVVAVQSASAASALRKRQVCDVIMVLSRGRWSQIADGPAECLGE